MDMRKWTSAVATCAAAALVLLPSRGAQAQIVIVDPSPPICKLLSMVNTPPRSIILYVQAPINGLASIQYAALNAVVTILPAFPVFGTTPPFFVPTFGY